MSRIDAVIYSNEDFQQVKLSCGFYETTYILLKDEKKEVDIHCSGLIKIFDEKNKLISQTKAPKSEGGREIYMDVLMKVEHQQVFLKFPIYEWIDHYPHCDGESDRWSTNTLGYHDLLIGLG